MGEQEGGGAFEHGVCGGGDGGCGVRAPEIAPGCAIAGGVAGNLFSAWFSFNPWGMRDKSIEAVQGFYDRILKSLRLQGLRPTEGEGPVDIDLPDMPVIPAP